MNQIIGIIGAERVGKDTLADYVVEKYGFKKYNFATPIKQIANIIFPHWDSADLDKDVIDQQTKIKPRDFYKWLGTDICQIEMFKQFPALLQYIKPRSTWSHLMTQTVQNSTDNWIIPDVRFIHEADAIIALGGILINVTSTSTSTSTQSTYEIDQILTNYYNIHNIHNPMTTKSDYYENIENALKKLIKLPSISVGAIGQLPQETQYDVLSNSICSDYTGTSNMSLFI